MIWLRGFRYSTMTIEGAARSEGGGTLPDPYSLLTVDGWVDAVLTITAWIAKTTGAGAIATRSFVLPI